MRSDREKLIDLLRDVQYLGGLEEKIAGHLLANGVVVREKGEWESRGGDLHSSGYAIFCPSCNAVHFVHYKNSLGGLCCKELFEKPNFCPNCGADMRKGENDG